MLRVAVPNKGSLSETAADMLAEARRLAADAVLPLAGADLGDDVEAAVAGLTGVDLSGV